MALSLAGGIAVLALPATGLSGCLKFVYASQTPTVGPAKLVSGVPAPPDESEHAETADLEVRVVSASIVPEPSRSRPVIELTLRFRNLTSTTKLDGLVFERRHVRVTDAYRNQYAHADSADALQGSYVGNIYPGESIDLPVRFEAPIASTAFVELEVDWPARRFGFKPARLRVPSSVWRQPSTFPDSPYERQMASARVRRAQVE